MYHHLVVVQEQLSREVVVQRDELHRGLGQQHHVLQLGLRVVQLLMHRAPASVQDVLFRGWGSTQFELRGEVVVLQEEL